NQKKIDKILDRMVRKSEDEVIKVYANRYKEIIKEIDKLYRKYESNGVLTMAEMSKYNRLDKSLDNITGELLKAQDSSYRLAQKTMEQQFIENYFRSAYLYEFESQRKLGFGQISKETIQAAIENPIDKLTLPAIKSRNRKIIVDKIRNEISQGLIRGSSYQQMTRIIRNLVDFDANKARTVVATEAHRAQVIGRDMSARQASKYVNIRKKWSSALDDRTRDAHQELDGVTIDLDDDFYSDAGGVGKMPGQMNNASDDINCRCSVLYVVDDNEPEVRRDGQGNVIPYMSYKEWYKNRIEKAG